ncbi:MAG: sigma-54 dependent transcriptional regulator [Thermodesulfovibrionales bacterium]|nr:sigma-54 dependent transcriptional regulator [Thermodesulfovibrionales bacterium]
MKILIVDDDKNLRKVLVNELSDAGYEVSQADNGIKAVQLIEKEEQDVLLLDLNMPGMNGMEILKQLRELDIPTEVVILTAYATVSTAVEAMKNGAYDYLTKPFQIEELITAVERAYEKKRLLSENLLLKSQLKRQTERKKIVTNHPLMLEVLETARKFALSAFPVLISGESGVGKELVAQAVHDSSPRSEGPFIPINCGAIPDTMLESELFGHEKGAFTGAYAKKPGLLEIANHGSVFLDEIGELSPVLQGKLLRVIENGNFFRVGGIKEVGVDVRFVSATNKDINKEVEEGRFRQDLYYRISSLALTIPPLRERKEDIPLLVEHIIKSTGMFKNRGISKKALKVLAGYSWPGNVRELQNVVHRSLFLSRNQIIDEDELPADMLVGRKTSGRKLGDIEREHILKVYREVNGQKRKAAQILGVDPKTLYRKLSSYGIKE